MGEELGGFRAAFNGSVRVEARRERLTSEAGAVLLREAVERLGMGSWFARRLEDRRSPDAIVHPLAELLLTKVLLLGQGWQDNDDADALRDDPALRLAVSTRRGTRPLEGRLEDEADPPSEPMGLPSQPTLSRFVDAMCTECNRRVLRDGLVEFAARRWEATYRMERPEYLTLDVDGLPVDVHGHQPGSEYNGHYHARIYHPLVTSIAETGDIIDARLRHGTAHAAEGALETILEQIDRVEARLCRVASVRMDAGMPDEKLLGALEARRTGYVARVRNNARLDRLAEPYLERPAGRPTNEPRTWLHETTYKADTWSRERRVVLIVQEREGELFLHHFWLITNWTAQDMPAETLLTLYRERGTAEQHMGELMHVLEPALSSNNRSKSHVRGRPPNKRGTPCDAFAHNETLLLLNVLGYEVVHAVRVLVEHATHEGWSLMRVRARVLRVAARVLVHGRRVVLVLGDIAARLWELLAPYIAMLRLAEA